MNAKVVSRHLFAPGEDPKRCRHCGRVESAHVPPSLVEEPGGTWGVQDARGYVGGYINIGDALEEAFRGDR